MTARIVLVALVLSTTLAAPADAQRPRSDALSTSAKTTTSTPLQDAASMQRAGRSAGEAALALVRTHRMKSEAVASTLIRVGYASAPVGRALVEDLKASPESAAGDLEGAGVRDPRELYGALLQMTRTRPEALKILKARKGTRVAIDVFGGDAGGDPPSAEEAAAEMDAAGFTLIEIADWLMRGVHELSAEEVLALFLELGLADPNQASLYEWLRGQGLGARDAAAAAAGAGVDDVASLLKSAGYGWDAILDALEWLEGTALEAARKATEAGAPVADVVRWLLDTEKATIDEILDEYQEQFRIVLGVILESSERQAELLKALNSIHGSGVSLADIVEFLMDQGLSPEEIAEILAEMNVSLAKRLEIMTTVMGLTHDAAMAIIGNI